LLVALSFCWGLSWTAMRIALDEVSPWGMRLIGYSIGWATLFILLKAQGRNLAIPHGKDWGHVFIAAMFLAVIIVGDRPTIPDMVGFALIFSAAACVMIPQRAKPPPDPARAVLS